MAPNFGRFGYAAAHVLLEVKAATAAFPSASFAWVYPLPLLAYLG